VVSGVIFQEKSSRGKLSRGRQDRRDIRKPGNKTDVSRGEKKGEKSIISDARLESCRRVSVSGGKGAETKRPLTSGLIRKEKKTADNRKGGSEERKRSRGTQRKDPTLTDVGGGDY